MTVSHAISSYPMIISIHLFNSFCHFFRKVLRLHSLEYDDLINFTHGSFSYAYVNFLTDFYAILHQPMSERKKECAFRENAMMMMKVFYFHFSVVR